MAGDLDIKRGQEEEGPMDETTHPTMTRIDLVIIGVDRETKGWEFMMEAIESVIENYGGIVVEFETFPSPSSRVDQVMNQNNQ